MKGIAELRERLGLTQQELADFLQMERSTLSLIELSRREFSADTLVKLKRLQMADIKSQYKLEINESSTPTNGLVAELSSVELQEAYRREFNELLSERITECMQEVERLLSKMRHLEERATMAAHKQKVLKYLKETPPTDAETQVYESGWIAVQENEVNRYLAPKQKSEITKLKVRAAALQIEALYLDQSLIASA